MAALPQKRYWTPEEYLAFERESDTRHEYLDGEIFDTAAANDNHNKVSGNTFASLHTQVRKRDCVVYTADMRLKTPHSDVYTYPDVIIVCGQVQFDPQSEVYTLLNPSIIVEVLSPSTEQYDRGEKFRRYRGIPSLQEYVLIAQDKPLAERFARQADGSWRFTDAQGLEAVMPLDSIGCTLALADVYEKVDFEAQESRLEQKT